MLATILHRPRKLWLRRALFQVHLWAGLVLAVYVAVIGLSGSLLVFQDEIRLASLRPVPPEGKKAASIDAVMARTREQFPAWQLTYIGFPQRDSPWWTVYLEDGHGKRDLAYADAASGEPLKLRRRLLIDAVLDLHVYLLAGHTGFIVNCVAGIGLLLLAVTGAVLWWPGILLWKRALTVSLRHRWRRINYDLHNAVGIWMLALVSWWGITAVYFLLPAQVSAVVNAVSPLVGMKAPAARAAAGSGPGASLDAILAQVPPGEQGKIAGVGLPEKSGGRVSVYVDRGRAGDFSHRNIMTFDGHTGELLTVWHYGENHSPGDWVLWLMYPLHFGTVWGMGVKVLWFLFGLSLPVLSVTGILMYWNRWLRSAVGRKTASGGRHETHWAGD